MTVAGLFLRDSWETVCQRVRCLWPIGLFAGDRLSTDAPDRASAERSATFLRKFHVSGRKLDEAAPACSWWRYRS